MRVRWLVVAADPFCKPSMTCYGRGMELQRNTGHLIVTGRVGEYEDRTVVAVVVGTAEEAQRAADEMTIDAVREAAGRSSSTHANRLCHRVEDTVEVRTFSVPKD